MEFMKCESIAQYLSDQELHKDWQIVLPTEIYNETDLLAYYPETPIRTWVRPDGVQKWVIGNGNFNHMNGAITLLVSAESHTTLAHESATHSVLGTLPSTFTIARSSAHGRINSLNIMVNELEVRMRSISEENVRISDRLKEEKLRHVNTKDRELDATRLISILRERVLKRDAEIVGLKEDLSACQKRIVDLDTSLEIANATLKEEESTQVMSTLISVKWPIRASELRVTAMPRITISKQDVCVGSYILHLVELETFYINSGNWFSAEVSDNAIKRLLLRWMNGYHPTAAQNGSAVSRQAPAYRFTPQDILNLISEATGSNFFLVGYQTLRECDWSL